MDHLPWPTEKPENTHCGQKPAVYSARGQTVRWCKVCGASQEFDGGSWSIPTVTRALQKEIEQQNILIVQLKERIALISPMHEENRRELQNKLTALEETNDDLLGDVQDAQQELVETQQELARSRHMSEGTFVGICGGESMTPAEAVAEILKLRAENTLLKAKANATEDDLGMAHGCLELIREALVSIKCDCAGHDGKGTPPMMFPEWIACCAKRFERELAEARTEIDRLQLLYRRTRDEQRPARLTRRDHYILEAFRMQAVRIRIEGNWPAETVAMADMLMAAVDK